MIFPDSRMYHTTDGVDREKLNPCQVVVREEAMIIEYVDEFGSRVTYQARQIAEGQFEIRQEIEEEDYLYTATLQQEGSGFYDGRWFQRYGNQQKRGSWSIELA